MPPAPHPTLLGLKMPTIVKTSLELVTKTSTLLKDFTSARFFHNFPTGKLFGKPSFLQKSLGGTLGSGIW